MSLTNTDIRRGLVIRKIATGHKYIVVFCDADGTLFACRFKRRARGEYWDRVTNELVREKRTGLLFTVVKHCTRPLLAVTEVIEPKDLGEWEDVDEQEIDFRPESRTKVPDKHQGFQ
jgi:alpha-tubulin suppressor-like RCC1 family protein